ncbi:hypothetical protein [Halorientalis regularis]|nr:hypothetical protein [Halorientalis regularis]
MGIENSHQFEVEIDFLPPLKGVGFRYHRVSGQTAMNNIHDAVRSLLAKRRQYAKEAVVDIAVRDQQMSDNGADSLYTEKARALRRLEHKIENKTVDGDDLGLIAEAILRYELNKAVEQSPDQVSAAR